MHIDEGFDFLGWNFRKYQGKLLIKPSRKNVVEFYRKVSGIIKRHLSLADKTGGLDQRTESDPSGLGPAPLPGSRETNA